MFKILIIFAFLGEIKGKENKQEEILRDTDPSASNNGRFFGSPSLYGMYNVPPPGQFYPTQNGMPFGQEMMYPQVYPPMYGAYPPYYRPQMYAQTQSANYLQTYGNLYRKNNGK
ncbi:hypothetical protein HHI36_003515 [Cryptolaemus montrouzieri]|uniref:Uncharacterized protein n=1 Tax=Cryptolaemus montrouzieri TaxID=559131 RepID=A0ABD2PE41_9CUCU